MYKPFRVLCAAYRFDWTLRKEKTGFLFPLFFPPQLGGFVVAYALSRMSDFDAMNAHFVLCVLLACFQQWVVLGWAQRHHVLRSSPLVTTESASDRSANGIEALIRANAEGLISLPGYLCLFIYGTAIALLLRLHLELPASQPVDKLKVLCVQGKETW